MEHARIVDKEHQLTAEFSIALIRAIVLADIADATALAFPGPDSLLCDGELLSAFAFQWPTSGFRQRRDEDARILSYLWAPTTG